MKLASYYFNSLVFDHPPTRTTRVKGISQTFVEKLRKMHKTWLLHQEATLNYILINIFPLVRDSIFQPSEAQFFFITQNCKELLSFLHCVPKGLINFEYPILSLHSLNYHSIIKRWQLFIDVKYLIQQKINWPQQEFHVINFMHETKENIEKRKKSRINKAVGSL